MTQGRGRAEPGVNGARSSTRGWQRRMTVVIAVLMTLAAPTAAGAAANTGLFGWGGNCSGEVGLGGAATCAVFSPLRVKLAGTSTVAAVWTHTIAVSQGELFAWGEGQDGELGTGDSTPRATPTRIGTDVDWSTVSVGPHFSIGLKSDGSVWGWGANYGGQLAPATSSRATCPPRSGARPTGLR